MANEVVNYKKRGKVLPMETDDLTACLALAMGSLREHKGRSVIYENNEEGLKRFQERTLAFLQRVDEINRDLAEPKKIVPDMESWALHVGVCRKTLFNYRRRGGEWERFIERVIDAITLCKKTLAFHGKLPPVVLFFDLTNNSGYANTSEFKVTTKLAGEPGDKPQMRLEDLPDLAALEQGENGRYLLGQSDEVVPAADMELSNLPEFNEVIEQ